MKTLRHILCRTVIAVLPCALPAVAQTQAPKRTPAVAKVTVPGASQEQAQSTQVTIYKLVDDRGHVTYSNRPMKGAEVVDLEPITVIPNGPRPASGFHADQEQVKNRARRRRCTDPQPMRPLPPRRHAQFSFNDGEEGHGIETINSSGG